MEYQSNPKRGCGTKKEGGFYAECEMGPGGALAPWTWILGDGLEGGENCYASVPPRRSVYGNLAATLALGEFVSVDVPMGFGPAQEHLEAYYQDLVRRTSATALFDHVGSEFYSAMSFADECRQYGPSRRISPMVARELARHVPIPVVFTHSRMPLFRMDEHRNEMIGLAREIVLGWEMEYHQGANWLRPGWGIYARNEDGADHYLRPLLSVVSRIDRDWSNVAHNPLYQQAKALLEQCLFVEQAFGCSWITKVGYVPKKGEDVVEVEDRLAELGIETIRIVYEEVSE